MNKKMVFGNSCKMIHWIVASYILIAITVLLPIVGFIWNKPIAWWQSSLWVGTAYESIYLLFASTLLVFYRPLLEGCLVVLSTGIAALVCDSRAMQLDTCLVLVLLVCETIYRRYDETGRVMRGCPPSKYGLYIAVYISCLVLSLYIYLNYPGNPQFSFNPLVTVSKTTGIFSDKSEVDWGNDIDRKDQVDMIYERFKKKTIDTTFGNGILTHQLYYKKKGNSGRLSKYRPVGANSFVFDFGILTLTAVFISSIAIPIRAALKRQDVASLWSSTVQIILVISCFLHIFLTDTFDSILFWIIVTGNSRLALTKSQKQ